MKSAEMPTKAELAPPNTIAQSIKRTSDAPIATNWNPQLLDGLWTQLRTIRADLLRLEREFGSQLDDYKAHKESARNLIHYLAFRRHDIRQLQEELAALGLSSLGRTESHVLAGIEAVLKVLHHLREREATTAFKHKSGINFIEGKALLRANTDSLLGPPPRKRNVRIMVTAPREMADNYELVRQLVASGMNCMRVNCAHDDESTWCRMIANLQRAKEELRTDCRIEIDLAGPKLRTGAIDFATQIVKWRPQRDLRGHVSSPARIWLTPAENPKLCQTAACGCLHLPASVLAKLHKGDSLEFKDLRGKRRLLEVDSAHGQGRNASCAQTAYLSAGSALPFIHVSKSGRTSAEASVGPPAQSFIILKPGDPLFLTRESTPGRPAVYNEKGQIVRPATISCTLPEVFADLRANEPIWFDDGKIGGVIESVGADKVAVRITIARPPGDKLGPNKGINLPESAIRLPPLTQQDMVDLAFAVKHADIIGFSFVRRPEDIATLQAELARLNASDIGIVFKIETQSGFEHLPAILLQAVRSRHIGLMIARGDLAVECGWERLAEAQEEILWLCEAAHVPVIWATQVLENLARRGAPSRAEITDAAMGERAECVMLNKGPHLVQAVRVLDNILCRMEAHQSKKSARLRRLHLASMPDAA